MTDIAVVVPTLNEEDRVASALRSARRAFGPEADLVVVDGGSDDRTPERAREWARVVVEERPGRGRQLNAGAEAARGGILVFLHADTRLEAESADLVRRTLQQPGVVAGCFRFAVDPPAPPVSRWGVLEAGVRLRTSVFRTATGDQAIFTTRRAFDRIGGYPELPLFEDVVFVRRLRRLGRLRPVPAVARTSRRRWESRGFWATIFRHWALRGGFAAGIEPERLAEWYGAPEA